MAQGGFVSGVGVTGAGLAQPVEHTTSSALMQTSTFYLSKRWPSSSVDGGSWVMG